MNKKKLIIAGTAAVVIIAAAAVIAKSLTGGNAGGRNGGGMPGGQRGNGGPGGQQQEASYTVVKTENPHYGDVSVSSSLTGTVEASDVVHIYAKASGDVTAVNITAGDTVEAGQEIITIDTERVESAKNQLDSAKLNLDSASSDLNRMQLLYNGGDITAQEFEQYQDKYKSAKLSYDSAKLNYDQQLSYSSITASISGRVESVNVEVFDQANMNQELAVISGEGEKRITTYVSERMMQNLSAGDEIKVIKNGEEYTGHLTEISSIVGSDTGLFKVKAELENTDDIATGSTVKIIMVTEKSENVMLVPVDAIYYSGGDAYVYVVEDGVAHMKTVQVGLYDTEVAEIKEGLTDTDVVISTWSNNLYEGASVRLYDDVYAENAADGEQAGAVPSDSKNAAMPKNGDVDTADVGKAAAEDKQGISMSDENKTDDVVSTPQKEERPDKAGASVQSAAETESGDKAQQDAADAADAAHKTNANAEASAE